MNRLSSALLASSLIAACSGSDPGKPDGPGPTDDTGTAPTHDTETTDLDQDQDGHDGVDAGGDDCDDADPTIFPGATEIPYDGVDQDCADGDLVDVDGDGVDASEVGGADCDDVDPEVAPGERDTVGDGVDENCDDLDGEDVDLDGDASIRSGGGDCDDADPTVGSNATEVWYDGVDQDCDGGCDGDQDGDGGVVDGWTVTDGDPCDADPGPSASAPPDCDDTDASARAVLLSTSPVDGAVQVSPLRDVRATLWEEDPTADLSLVDPAGDPVAGVQGWVGWIPTRTFTPDAPLDPGATYTATLTWSCGTSVWPYTTALDGEPSVRHAWAIGSPDTLTVEVANPDATVYEFGMAETAASVFGWYGEDCAGPLSTGLLCHPMISPLVLASVYPDLSAVVPGSTTLFDASFDSAITYWLEAEDGPEQGGCWAWGNDPSYFAGCTAL